MNTNTEISLFDFLNYEIIGTLLLLLCNIMPNTLSPSWLFFVFAFIAGLIFSKLAENAFWTRWTRNPKCLLIEAKLDTRQSRRKRVLKNYYKDYYRLSRNATYKTVLILEAQYSFLYNLWLLLILYLIMIYYSEDSMIQFIESIKCGTFSIDCCKCCHVASNGCLTSINFVPLIVVYLVMLFFDILGWISCECFCDNNIKNQVIKSTRKDNEELKFIVRALYTLLFMLVAVLIYQNINLNNPISIFKWTLYALITTIPYIAYKIQLKISTLVIEGAYYLKELEKEENKQ